MTNVSEYQPSDFGPNPLPEWVRAGERWQQQMRLCSEISEAFEESDVVFLQAPTGVGKTLVGEISSRLLGGKALYVCSEKELQDQFERDFTYAKVLKGRSNYLTESGILDDWGKVKRNGPSSITCADCTHSSENPCNWCNDKSTCPYSVARVRAQSAHLACLNYSYFLLDAAHVGNFTGRRLLIADECDEIERQLLHHYEIVISGKRQAEMGLFPPDRKTVSNSWRDWVRDTAIPTVGEYISYLPTPQESKNVRDIKAFNRATELLGKLHVLKDELADGGWVYDGYSKDRKATDDIIFRPVRVDKWGSKVLWNNADKFLLMSATILSADVMADELGLEKPWQLIDVGSNFPVESRPIHIVSVADMSYKERVRSEGRNWEKMVKGVEGAVKLHPNDRVLTHCVSYELAHYLYNNTHIPGRNKVTYKDSSGKGEALRVYKKIPGSVMFAASMDRGVDLPGDLCRVQIVAKIPFPNIKDKRIAARLYSDGGFNWYRMQAIRTLIQMTGRGMRSADDWCVTYILDSQFMNNLWKSYHLFPAWWVEAIDWKINKGRLGV